MTIEQPDDERPPMPSALPPTVPDAYPFDATRAPAAVIPAARAAWNIQDTPPPPSTHYPAPPATGTAMPPPPPAPGPSPYQAAALIAQRAVIAAEQAEQAAVELTVSLQARAMAATQAAATQAAAVMSEASAHAGAPTIPPPPTHQS